MRFPMQHIGLQHIALLLVMTISVLTSVEVQAKEPAQLQTVKLFFENDLFGDTDKYYTNAVQLTWLSHDLKQYRDDTRLPAWAISVIDVFPFVNEPDSIHNVGVLLGQQIYTPSDIRATELLGNDHPYGGFLFGGIALHSKTDRVLDTMELVFGIVGPVAAGEFAQNSVHELRDIPTAEGWNYQLDNEPALNVSWQRKYKLYRSTLFDVLDYDLIIHGGITAGNVRIAGNGGGEVRLGFNIPDDFGSDVIRLGAGVSAPVRQKERESGFPIVPIGAHLFVSSQVEGVIRDIFLDGNTWTDSHSVDKKAMVADLSVGLACNIGMYKITYRHLFRTKKFEAQEEGQTIGSLSLTVAF